MDSLTLDGEGVGRIADREVLCRGVFPGEQAKVRIEAVSRHHPRAHARLVELRRRHGGRRQAPCPNHESRDGHCTGCPLMELGDVAQREAKRTMLRDRFELAVDRVEPAPATLGYRFSSKRVAFGRKGFVYLGSYAHGSHQAAGMRGCLVDHPRLVATFDAIERAVCELGVVPYDEKTGQGDLRYVWAKTNGSEVIVTLVTVSDETRVLELVPLLEREVAGVLHSVQPSRGNAMRGSTSRSLVGKSEVAIELLGQRVEVGALGFVQPNPQVAEAAYRALTALSPAVTQRQLAFDLYAGTGVTTRVLRESFAKVVACEAHAESAAALGIAPESVETFLARALTFLATRDANVDEGSVPDLVIANPPRKGLGPQVCGSLLSLRAPLLRIMSCGPEALAADLERLSAAYDLVELKAFDTLPQTPHIELVAALHLRD